MLTRGSLLPSMDLATVVADEENKLAELFVESGKMSELVESLARVSQLILQGVEGGAMAKGQEAKKLKKEKGMTPKLWCVNFHRKKGLDAME